MEGRRVLCFCSNNYLGLANHPALVEAAAASAHHDGVGAAASRLITGTMDSHRQAEVAFADFLGAPATVLFSTGYSANLGTIQALVGPGDAIFSDALNHASLVDGAAGAVMGVPEGPATVFWYDLSQWTDFGGLPGEGRNAIFSGHVDLASYVPYADVNYSGPAIFSDLELLQPGDRIFVDYNGESLEYVVAWKEQVNAGDTGRWGDIWSSNVATDSITLYTCGGEFNFAEASYIDRIVIRAERA